MHQVLSRRRPSTPQSGYVMATTALLLLPLMVFAAFAVDVGAWYAEADQAQRAADAAALAAVVELPKLNKAETVALEIVQKNGFDDAILVASGAPFDTTETRPQVRVDKLNDQSLRVHVQTKGDSYFGKVVLDDIDIERYAGAEYNLPVPMGSPQNILGYPVAAKIHDGAVVSASYGGLEDCDDIVAGFAAGRICASGNTLTLHGFCQSSHTGDLRSGGFVAGPNIDAWGCTIDVPDGVGSYSAGRDFVSPPASAGVIEFPTHDPDGYYYVVEVPAAAAYTPELWVFDAPFCTNDVVSGGDTLYWGGEGASNATGNRMQFRAWDMSLTPLDESELAGPPQLTWSVPSADLGLCKRWMNTGITFTRNAALGPTEPQRWYVQVRNDPAFRGGWAKGLGFFSLQVRMGGAETVCDARSTPTCPRLYARDSLPIRAVVRKDGSGNNLPTTFYLAQLDENVHQGKTLEVTMYDIGERMEYVRFLDPGGNPLDFTWDIIDGGPVNMISSDPPPWPSEEVAGPSCGAASGANTNPCLNVWPTVGGYRYAAWGSGGPAAYRFQGRQLRVMIPLDTNVTDWDMTGPGEGWFTVEYVTSDVAVDTTTWGVRVIGDPVRLTE